MKKREKEYNNHELFTIQENRMILKTEKQEAPTRCAEASMQYGMLWGLAKYNLIPVRSVLCLWLESRL